VGIGTTSPSTKLDIYGDGTNGAMINFGRNTAGYVGNIGAFGNDSTTLSINRLSGGTTKNLRIYDGGNTNIIMQVIGATGNVGIGTTSPQAKLDIWGNADALRISGTAGGTRYYNIGRNTTTGFLDFTGMDASPYSGYTFKVDSGATSAMTINSTGNVGIGTTSPYKLLSLGGTSPSLVFAPDNGNKRAFEFNANGSNLTFNSINGASSGSFRFQSEGTDVVTIDNTGIMVQSSGELLDLNRTGYGGVAWFINANAPYGTGGNLRQAIRSGSTFYTMEDTTGTDFFRWASSTNNVSFMGGYGGAGNVGIGTTTPDNKLTVYGFANVNGTVGGYKIDNNLILQASSTNYSTLVGQSAGSALLADGLYNTAVGFEALKVATSTDYNTAFGYKTLSSNTTGNYNTANGALSLFGNTTGVRNTANGWGSLQANTTGGYNIAVGYESLRNNTTASNNTAQGYRSLYENITGSSNTSIGFSSLSSNITGNYNTAVGYKSLFNNTSATNTTAIGFNAAIGTANYSNQGGTYLGYQSGYSAGTGSDYNTMLGYEAGYGVTTGANNILLGYNAGYSGTNLTTGSNNIIIGHNIGATSTDMTRGLNIGNLIFGTNLDGSGTTLSTGNIGIGTTSPWGKLSITGSGATSATYGLVVADSNNAPKFVVRNDGNVGVGTASPNGNFEVWGTSGEATVSNGINRYQTNSGTNDVSVKLGGVAGAGSAGYVWWQGAHAGVANDANLALNPLGGNVGIGTTSPLEKLHVYSANNAYVRLESAINQSSGFQMYENVFGVPYGFSLFYDGGSTNDFLIQSKSNDSLTTKVTIKRDSGNFGIGGDPGSAKLYVNGNVGIGTTSPYAKLSVVGQTVSEYFTATSTTATSTFPNLSLTNLLFGSDYLTDITGVGLSVSNGALTVSGMSSSTLANTFASFDAFGNLTGSTTLSTVFGGTGLSTSPSYGQLLLGNASGGYTLTSTSSLGITSGLASLTGSPLTKGYFLVGDDAGLSQATSSLFVSSTGNIGIGTSTPNSKLALSGGNFTHIASGNPTLAGTYDTSGNALDVYVSGKYAYVADGASGLQILDISNPASSTISSTYDTSGNARGVYVSGKYAYIADQSAGLQIIDISNPIVPVLAGTYDTSGDAYGVYVSGKYVYVADYGSGLQIIDISNPTSPTLVGTYDTPSFASNVYISSKYAYVSDSSSGLQIIDISNPTSPTLVGTYDTLGNVLDAYVSGKYVYVAGGNPGLQIFDISNPVSPILIGEYNTSGLAYSVHVSGKYAYIADSAAGLQIIDISNPIVPVLAGTYDTSGLAFGLHVSGKYAYVADSSSGLQIIDINGIETPSLYAGNIATNGLTVTENADFGNNLYVRNGLNVGMGGIFTDGVLSVAGTSSSFFGGNVGIGTTSPYAKTLRCWTNSLRILHRHFNHRHFHLPKSFSYESPFRFRLSYRHYRFWSLNLKRCFVSHRCRNLGCS
jgi:hypothetical protein